MTRADAGHFAADFKRCLERMMKDLMQIDVIGLIVAAIGIRLAVGIRQPIRLAVLPVAPILFFIVTFLLPADGAARHKIVLLVGMAITTYFAALNIVMRKDGGKPIFALAPVALAIALFVVELLNK